jgi:glutamate/tyrosine decarboxylase-like PLP-dependent enzyme
MTSSPRSPLDLDEATMRALGRRVADLVAAHLASLAEQPVVRTAGRREAVARVGTHAAEEGAAFESLLEELRANVLEYHAREPHPGFMGYIPSCPTFPAVLGDWIATGFNVFAGVWSVAAGPNALELVVLGWFREWLGMHDGTGGLLTSGGSQATLTAMLAARHHAIADDAARIARLTVYASDQAHSSVARAAWIAGVPRANVRAIPCDGALRLDVAALQDAIRRDRAQGFEPMFVTASAGTTSTGAIDPLEATADVCAAERVWMHVDAAYGGFAALSPAVRERMRGIERADSVTLDPHKWLFVPFECGGLLVREPSRLTALFRVSPDYLRDVEAADEEVNFADYGEQLTRMSRALKVWLSVRYFGVAALREAIEEAMRLARLAEALVRAEPALELLSPAQLGIVCFRVATAGLDDAAADALNERVNARVNAAGRVLISSTRLRGRFSLRMCILGYRTTEAEVRDVIEETLRAAATERAATTA